MKTRLDTTAIIIVVLFSVTFIYYLIAVFTTPFFNFWSLAPTILTGIYIYMSNYEYMVIVHQPKFKWKHGGYGTVISGINRLSGDKFTVKVAVKYRVVKGKENIKIIKHGLESFFTLIIGNVVIEFIGDINRLKSYMGETSDLPEGSYFYDGSITGADVPTEAKEKDSKITELSQSLSMYHGALEKVKAVNIALAQSADKDAMNASKRINLILKDTIEAGKPLIVQQSPRRVQEGGEPYV